MQIRDDWLPRVRKEPGCVDRRPFDKITNKTKERERRDQIVASGRQVYAAGRLRELTMPDAV